MMLRQEVGKTELPDIGSLFLLLILDFRICRRLRYLGRGIRLGAFRNDQVEARAFAQFGIDDGATAMLLGDFARYG